MKKLIISAVFPWIAIIFGQKAMAQEPAKETENKKETQEIVIRKKGDKDVTLNLQITGDKVIVNGKPLMEFSDDAITINKKKIVINTDKWSQDLKGITGEFSFDDFKQLNGISIAGTDNNTRAFLGVFTAKTDDGAKITEVTKASAAEIAGLRKDDIITKINDTKVNGPQELLRTIGKMKPNDEVKVTYKRGSDKEKTVKAKLKETQGIEVSSFTFTSPEGVTKELAFPRPPQTPGMAWRDNGTGINSISIRRTQKLGIKIQDTEEGNGVKILDVDENSPAATAGVKKDDILTELNGEKITNTDEAREQLQANLENNNYPLKVKRNGNEMTLNVKIPKKLKTADL